MNLGIALPQGNVEAIDFELSVRIAVNTGCFGAPDVVWLARLRRTSPGLPVFPL